MQHLHCRCLEVASEEVASCLCHNYSLGVATTSFSSKDADCPAMLDVGLYFSMHTKTFLILKGM